MTAGRTTAQLTDGVALLERAMGYALGSLALVRPECMTNRTPCREWDVRALLLHLDDSFLALHEAIAVGDVDVDPAAGRGDANPVDPVARLRVRASRAVGAWANAPGPSELSVGDRTMSSRLVAATGAVEVAVHGWDVARACGQDRPIPAALAAELLELAPLLVTDDDRPRRFAARVEVSRPAGPTDRLLGFLGRRSTV